MLTLCLLSFPFGIDAEHIFLKEQFCIGCTYFSRIILSNAHNVAKVLFMYIVAKNFKSLLP